MTPRRPQGQAAASVNLKDTGCKPQAHGQSEPGGGLCPRCSRPRCTAAAKTRPGERCRKNPHPGASICTNHGLTAAGREAAERRVAEAKAEELLNTIWRVDADPVVDAVTALQQLAGRLQHAADALGRRVDDGSTLDGATAVAWLKVLRELRQALVGMERLDLQARVIELDRGRADLVTAAFRAAAAAVGERLLPADRTVLIDTFLERLGEPRVVAGEVVEP